MAVFRKKFSVLGALKGIWNILFTGC